MGPCDLCAYKNSMRSLIVYAFIDMDGVRACLMLHAGFERTIPISPIITNKPSFVFSRIRQALYVVRLIKL
jgi:hypothetical protein